MKFKTKVVRSSDGPLSSSPWHLTHTPVHPSPLCPNYQTVGMWSICGGVGTPSSSHCSFSPLTILVLPPQCIITIHTLPWNFFPCVCAHFGCVRVCVYEHVWVFVYGSGHSHTCRHVCECKEMKRRRYIAAQNEADVWWWWWRWCRGLLRALNATYLSLLSPCGASPSPAHPLDLQRSQLGRNAAGRVAEALQQDPAAATAHLAGWYIQIYKLVHDWIHL